MSARTWGFKSPLRHAPDYTRASIDEDSAVRVVRQRDAKAGVNSSLVGRIGVSEHPDHVLERSHKGLDLGLRQARRRSGVDKLTFRHESLGAHVGDPPPNDGGVGADLERRRGSAPVCGRSQRSWLRQRHAGVVGVRVPLAAASASQVSSRCSGSNTVASRGRGRRARPRRSSTGMTCSSAPAPAVRRRHAAAARRCRPAGATSAHPPVDADQAREQIELFGGVLVECSIRFDPPTDQPFETP